MAVGVRWTLTREGEAACISKLRNYATVRLSRHIRRGAGRQQIMVQGKQGQLQAVADSQLVEDVGQMALHGFLADPETDCNVLVGGTLGNQSDHLELAAGE